MDYEEPADVAIFDGFKDMSEAELLELYSSLNLAMTFKDFQHIQNYFVKDEHRDPTMTEIRVLDTYWSDHCRHTTFSTELTSVKFDEGDYKTPIEKTYKEYLDILRAVRKLDKVKKVFIRSGVRFDYIMADPDPTFFDEMCEYHISGLLKVAPEHVSPHALHYMGKPQRKVFDAFVKRYFDYNRRVGKEQYLVPYFISATIQSRCRTLFLHRAAWPPPCITAAMTHAPWSRCMCRVTRTKKPCSGR